MCRLLGLLGNPSSTAERWLVESDRALLRQADISAEQLQSDGWGIAWLDAAGNGRFEKGVGCANSPEESKRFRSAAKRAKGPVILGHLRKASNPLNLSHERLIALENSQPFGSGSILFAHNGSIPYPREVRALLGPLESEVRGVNDSEVLFWLLMRHLEEDKEPLAAYAHAVRTLQSVWTERGGSAAGPFTGLNVLLTRGTDEIWAFCLSRGDHGGALFDAARPYYEMAYWSDAKELLVASEPLDSRPSAWRSLPNGHYLHGRVDHGLVAVDTGAVPIPRELLATPLAPPAGTGGR